MNADRPNFGTLAVNKHESVMLRVLFFWPNKLPAVNVDASKLSMAFLFAGPGVQSDDRDADSDVAVGADGDADMAAALAAADEDGGWF